MKNNDWKASMEREYWTDREFISGGDMHYRWYLLQEFSGLYADLSNTTSLQAWLINSAAYQHYSRSYVLWKQANHELMFQSPALNVFESPY